MTSAALRRSAERIVRRCLDELPEPLAGAAREVPVLIEDFPSEELVADGLDEDILGLFVGDPVGVPGEPGPPPCILLFTENILWESREAGTSFEEEVARTYLHELGHLLGFDEEDVAARGLE